VLGTGEIQIGDTHYSFREIAEDFDFFIKQEGDSRRLKVEHFEFSGNPTFVTESNTLPAAKAHLQQFLNQSNSALAYLIQRTANFIHFEAARGYGTHTNRVDKIQDDAVFGNQTKRALAGLKNWIESSHEQNIEKSSYTEQDILKMDFVSNGFLTSLEQNHSQLFNKFWTRRQGGGFNAAEGYRLVQDWSNNYAIEKVGHVTQKMQQIIDKLGLIMDMRDKSTYSRETFSGKYKFDAEGTLFYLGDFKLPPQRYDQTADRRINDNSFVVASLGLV